MTRTRALLMVVTGMALWLWFAAGTSSAAAQAFEEEPGFGQTAELPPLPGLSPALFPSLVQSYHRHDTIPVEEASVTGTTKWIDMDLSEQRVVAYEGKRALRAFIVSTGLPGTPTVQGEFRIWVKTRIQDMSGGNRAAGDYYYLENVQWVQYFYEDYGFHGTYWHNNYGQPMSRGCVNMTNEDAEWLFNWTSPDWKSDGPAWQSPADGQPGTLVIVHE